MPNLTNEQQIMLLTGKLKSLFDEIKIIRDDAKEADRDANNFPKFRGKYKELESLYSAYNKAWDELFELHLILDKEKDFPFDEKTHKALIRTYVYECHTVFETRMNPVPSPCASRPSLNTALLETGDISLNTSGRNRLPKINIPSFHGDILKWPQFRDIFLSMVHDDDSITLIEKFHYLVGALSGEPFQIVSAFPMSAANYASAWESLNRRFNNKRVLASSYLQRIRSFRPSAQQFDNLTHLRSFLNAVGESFSALRSLEIANEADFLKLYLALECLDSDTRKLYEDKQQGQEFPTYDSLIEFIQQRCQILELSATSIPIRSATPKASDIKPSRSHVLATVESRPLAKSPPTQDQIRYSCPKCEGDHLLFRCLTFKGMSPLERMDFVKKNHLCFNCLRPGHFPTKCPSKHNCAICRRKHHSFLHQSPNHTTTNITSTSTSQPNSTPSHPSTSTDTVTDTPSPGLVGVTAGCKTVLLGTAVVNMRDWKGSLCPIRIVIDSGSQFSIITTDCAKRLGLAWSPTKRTISAVGCVQPPPAKGTLFCQLSPINQDGMEVHTTALVMPSIIPNIPSISLSPEISKFFNSVNLADDVFWESRPIDFLLGSDLFLQILLPEPTHKITDNFGTLATIFGQVVIGVPPSNDESDKAADCLAITEPPLSHGILKDFRPSEEALLAKHPHSDDAACQTHFKNNLDHLAYL
ncbi:hypothetical protein O3M35_007679 [Rhynocoris fuscipes]|uniref:CCHC-type domain-containing protein n=1 Tax=Rhynocoris fuscipes TaxID=488301 RepID=A0AAW1DA78_9HEMI